jgi:penicillin-binding protein 1A
MDPTLERLFAARHARLRRRTRHRRSALLIVALLLAAILALVLATVAFTGSQLLLSSCSLKDLRPLALGENSFLYNSDGSFLGVVPSSTNRQPVPLSKMTPWLPQATVAIEDARFWQHGALDYQGIFRALYQDVSQGKIVQGGSTITQELVRNLYIGNPQRTLARKLREACLAQKLFGRMSRKQILSAYLNEVFYGRHAFGAQAGAQTYFSTTAAKLTLPQAALLAGLPQAPTTFDPLRNPRGARIRRNQVLSAMWKNGYISKNRYLLARRKPLELHPGKLYSLQHQPNFFGWAQQQLAKEFGARRVEAGGLNVTTTLDPRMQREALTSVESVLRTPTDPAAAVVALDPRTGAVKAMVSYLPDHRKMQFNLAAQAHRSTGSAFKAITLATALHQGVSLYSTFYGPPELYITDPQCATNGGPWDVHNNADESEGTMNLFDATANSVNTIFAQLIAKVGVKNTVRMAHLMGIRSYLKPVCAITLGAVGVTPLELTDAYATIADGGIHHSPQAFRSVRTSTGKVIGRLSSKGDRVLTENQAALEIQALEGVIQKGTGTSAAIGRPAAGKTGTAENYQDAWFCGFVPQLATCVWIGYPKAEIPMYDIEGVYEMFGGTLPAEIWREFMSQAVGPMPVENFPTPTSYSGTYISGSGTYGYAYGSSSSSGYYTTPYTPYYSTTG